MASTKTNYTSPVTTVELARSPKYMGRFNRWDTPWFNLKLLTGITIIGVILLIGILGRLFWDTNLAYTASSPLNLPPVGFENSRGQVGTWEHPLGTENSGRDMLAVMIMGAPNSLMIGVIAASVGMSVGIVLGFSSGFIGGRVDDVIRLISDVTITIPSLMVLIVIQALLTQVELTTMALLIALFAWPSPTRLIRAQVLSMKESGYVQMARLSGASTFDIMFKEIMPNLLPYLAASWIGNAAGAILAAIGLEVLGLGPQRVPTLGGTIYFALEAAALLRNMWWWWGLPTLTLATIFVGLLLINLGLDEIANPRLRQASQ
jgi:peptide/nickel transport system permease protein